MSDGPEQRQLSGDELLMLVRGTVGDQHPFFRIVATEVEATKTPGSSITSYNWNIMPGDLQTPDYTQAVFQALRTPDSKRESGGRIRRARGELVAASGLRRVAFIHEGALRNPPNDNVEVLKAQVDHLAGKAALLGMGLGVRIVPEATPVDQLPSSNFLTIDMPDREPTIVLSGGPNRIVNDPVEVEEILQQSQYLDTVALDQGDSLTFMLQVAAEL